jgi:hypothetical protein
LLNPRNVRFPPIADVDQNDQYPAVRWLFASVAMLTSVSASASDTAFCDALDQLKVEAARSRTPQRVAIFKEEAFTFACGRTDGNSTQEAFCSAALPVVGLEFTHGFPWHVRACLRARGIEPGLETAAQYTGLRDREKIRHLWGAWRDGTRIDIQFEPTGDFSDDNQFKDYWGVYRMVIWMP